MHRDSPGPEPEAADLTDRVEPSRRFRRLVESSAARRLALPRLGLAVGVGLSAVVLTIFVGIGVVRSVTTYVADLPEQQIPFSKIELVPEPDPWIRGGKARILAQVQAASKRGEMVRLLDLDKKQFANEFLLGSSWIKKVEKVELPPRGLVVRVEYRKPVAVVILKREPEIAFLIDGDAVPLPWADLNKTSQDPYKIEGMAGSLIQIMGVDPNSKTTFGVPWKQVSEDGKSDEPDLMVLRAARLADFLGRQSLTTPSGLPAAKITRIYLPEGPNHPYMLKAEDSTLVCWAKPPGLEEPGELTAADRWRMWLNWLDLKTPILEKKSYYLDFNRDGAFVRPFRSRTAKDDRAH